MDDHKNKVQLHSVDVDENDFWNSLDDLLANNPEDFEESEERGEILRGPYVSGYTSNKTVSFVLKGQIVIPIQILMDLKIEEKIIETITYMIKENKGNWGEGFGENEYIVSVSVKNLTQIPNSFVDYNVTIVCEIETEDPYEKPEREYEHD